MRLPHMLGICGSFFRLRLAVLVTVPICLAARQVTLMSIMPRNSRFTRVAPSGFTTI